ncbi:hypothetical protein ACTXT7_000897 [Hymenolepis weldensis]
MFEKLDKYSNKLELEVEKRKEEMEMEKKKNEQLVCRMLPPMSLSIYKCVAVALTDGVTVAPEMYDEVLIYFSDIIGSTPTAAMSTQMEVVNLLNDIYMLLYNYDSKI